MVRGEMVPSVSIDEKRKASGLQINGEQSEGVMGVAWVCGLGVGEDGGLGVAGRHRGH